ncbi:MAG: translation initiation factor IF-3 [Victivallales bacterium]|nr:translation initiation factor IF-3 [Victivallales bacterium]
MIRESGRLLAGRDVMVVDQNGEKQENTMSVADALAMAKRAGLDLVLVAENADPPVCRIMDFGKLQYEHKKRQRDQKKTLHANKLKEVKYRLRIEKHDYECKLGHVIEFLDKGHKVKISLMFRGREMAHKDFGLDLVRKVIEDLDEHGKADSEPRMVGRSISVTLTPSAKKGRH